MYKQIKNYDKWIIMYHAIFKAVRGIWLRHFLKKVKGMLWVGKCVQVTHGRHITCGHNVKFEDYSEIQGLSEEGLIFGDGVTIGRGVMIRPSSYYGKDLGKGLIMGDNSSIGPHGYIGCSGKIVIGKNVMLGPKCSLFAENHIFDDVESTIKSQGVSQKGIVIEDDCWIGSNCIILDGVTIGRGSVIGAGSLISKDVERYSVVIDKKNKVMHSRNREQ